MEGTFNPCVRLFEEVSVSWSLPEAGIAEIEKEVREKILTVSQTLLLQRGPHCNSTLNTWVTEKLKVFYSLAPCRENPHYFFCI